MAVILPLLSTFNPAGVKAAQASLSSLGGAVASIGKQAILATGAFQGLQGVINFANDAVSQARDLERNMAALETVFGNLTPRMTEFTENAYKMGLSQVDAARTSTFLGSVLKQAGLPMDQVAQKTEELTTLAQDLATTYGYDTSEALTAMTALFRGEYDPIEKFGVALKQNEVNALVAAKGLDHLTGVELLNAQQTVRMEQLFLRSADAQGAFARQTGTLFVEQKKLTAVFENMQAAVGSRLTPALAGLMTQMTPIVEELTPVLADTFREVGQVVDDLATFVEPLGGIFVGLLDIVNDLVAGFEALLTSISPVLLEALEFLENLVTHIASGIDELVTLVGDLKEAFDRVPEGPVLDFLMKVYDLVNILTPALNPLVHLMTRFNLAFPGEAPTTDFTDRGAAARYGAMGDFYRAKARFEEEQKRQQQEGQKKKDAVAEFYKNLADDIKKEAAILKLKTMGASEAFIQSVVGSGKDWKKVFKQVSNLGTTGVSRLQAQFNKTAAGKNEIYKKLEEAAKAAHEAAMEQYRKDLEVFNDQKRLFDAQVAAIANFKDAIASITDTIKPMAVAIREIGQYEQAAIDAFTNIASTVKDALKEGTLTKTAAAELNKYAEAEKNALVRIGMERDKVANKRSLAQSVLQDVKDAIVGIGNITSLIEKQTKQVTVSITKMVGNLKVTTSRTIDEVINTGGLVSSFKNILDKTRNFASQLRELRKLGLDQNLYKQIVDAGIDAGSTTAEEIIKGGAGTVTELNNLFTELNSTGASIAEETAQVMYGAGVNITNGIIEGLISQEQLLVDQAKKMADAFITAFNEKMATMVVPTITVPNMPTEPVYQAPEMPTTQSVAYSLAELKKINLATVTSDAIWKENAKLAAKLIATPQYKSGNVITVNVSTAVGTNGKTVGKAIQAELNKYLKATSK